MRNGRRAKHSHLTSNADHAGKVHSLTRTVQYSNRYDEVYRVRPRSWQQQQQFGHIKCDQ